MERIAQDVWDFALRLANAKNEEDAAAICTSPPVTDKWVGDNLGKSIGFLVIVERYGTAKVKRRGGGGEAEWVEMDLDSLVCLWAYGSDELLGESVLDELPWNRFRDRLKKYSWLPMPNGDFVDRGQETMDLELWTVVFRHALRNYAPRDTWWLEHPMEHAYDTWIDLVESPYFSNREYVRDALLGLRADAAGRTPDGFYGDCDDSHATDPHRHTVPVGHILRAIAATNAVTPYGLAVNLEPACFAVVLMVLHRAACEGTRGLFAYADEADKRNAWRKTHVTSAHHPFSDLSEDGFFLSHEAGRISIAKLVWTGLFDHWHVITDAVRPEARAAFAAHGGQQARMPARLRSAFGGLDSNLDDNYEESAGRPVVGNALRDLVKASPMLRDWRVALRRCPVETFDTGEKLFHADDYSGEDVSRRPGHLLQIIMQRAQENVDSLLHRPFPYAPIPVLAGPSETERVAQAVRNAVKEAERSLVLFDVVCDGLGLGAEETTALTPLCRAFGKWKVPSRLVAEIHVHWYSTPNPPTDASECEDVEALSLLMAESARLYARRRHPDDHAVRPNVDLIAPADMRLRLEDKEFLSAATGLKVSGVVFEDGHMEKDAWLSVGETVVAYGTFLALVLSSSPPPQTLVENGRAWHLLRGRTTRYVRTTAAAVEEEERSKALDLGGRPVFTPYEEVEHSRDAAARMRRLVRLPWRLEELGTRTLIWCNDPREFLHSAVPHPGYPDGPRDPSDPYFEGNEWTHEKALLSFLLTTSTRRRELPFVEATVSDILEHECERNVSLGCASVVLYADPPRFPEAAAILQFTFLGNYVPGRPLGRRLFERLAGRDLPLFVVAEDNKTIVRRALATYEMSLRDLPPSDTMALGHLWNCRISDAPQLSSHPAKHVLGQWMSRAYTWRFDDTIRARLREAYAHIPVGFDCEATLDQEALEELSSASPSLKKWIETLRERVIGETRDWGGVALLLHENFADVVAPRTWRLPSDLVYPERMMEEENHYGDRRLKGDSDWMPSPVETEEEDADADAEKGEPTRLRRKRSGSRKDSETETTNKRIRKEEEEEEEEEKAKNEESRNLKRRKRSASPDVDEEMRDVDPRLRTFVTDDPHHARIRNVETAAWNDFVTQVLNQNVLDFYYFDPEYNPAEDNFLGPFVFPTVPTDRKRRDLFRYRPVELLCLLGQSASTERSVVPVVSEPQVAEAVWLLATDCLLSLNSDRDGSVRRRIACPPEEHASLGKSAKLRYDVDARVRVDGVATYENAPAMGRQHLLRALLTNDLDQVWEVLPYLHPTDFDVAASHLQDAGAVKDQIVRNDAVIHSSVLSHRWFLSLRVCSLLAEAMRVVYARNDRAAAVELGRVMARSQHHEHLLGKGELLWDFSVAPALVPRNVSSMGAYECGKLSDEPAGVPGQFEAWFSFEVLAPPSTKSEERRTVAGATTAALCAVAFGSNEGPIVLRNGLKLKDFPSTAHREEAERKASLAWAVPFLEDVEAYSRIRIQTTKRDTNWQETTASVQDASDLVRFALALNDIYQGEERRSEGEREFVRTRMKKPVALLGNRSMLYLKKKRRGNDDDAIVTYGDGETLRTLGGEGCTLRRLFWDLISGKFARVFGGHMRNERYGRSLQSVMSASIAYSNFVKTHEHLAEWYADDEDVGPKKRNYSSEEDLEETLKRHPKYARMKSRVFDALQRMPDRQVYFGESFRMAVNRNPGGVWQLLDIIRHSKGGRFPLDIVDGYGNAHYFPDHLEILVDLDKKLRDEEERKKREEEEERKKREEEEKNKESPPTLPPPPPPPKGDGKPAAPTFHHAAFGNALFLYLNYAVRASDQPTVEDALKILKMGERISTLAPLARYFHENGFPSNARLSATVTKQNEVFMNTLNGTGRLIPLTPRDLLLSVARPFVPTKLLVDTLGIPPQTAVECTVEWSRVRATPFVSLVAVDALKWKAIADVSAYAVLSRTPLPSSDEDLRRLDPVGYDTVKATLDGVKNSYSYWFPSAKPKDEHVTPLGFLKSLVGDWGDRARIDELYVVLARVRDACLENGNQNLAAVASAQFKQPREYDRLHWNSVWYDIVRNATDEPVSYPSGEEKDPRDKETEDPNEEVPTEEGGEKGSENDNDKDAGKKNGTANEDDDEEEEMEVAESASPAVGAVAVATLLAVAGGLVYSNMKHFRRNRR